MGLKIYNMFNEGEVEFKNRLYRLAILNINLYIINSIQELYEKYLELIENDMLHIYNISIDDYNNENYINFNETFSTISNELFLHLEHLLHEIQPNIDYNKFKI